MPEVAARAPARVGGLLLAGAGTAQLLGATTLLLPGTAALVPPLVQLAAWAAGSVLLLCGAVVVAVRTDASRAARIAMGAFGFSGLVQLAAVLLALAVGIVSRGTTAPALIGEQLLVLTASSAAAIAYGRARARHALLLLAPVAVTDLATTMLALLVGPTMPFLIGILVVRPSCIAAAGVLLAIGRRPRRGEVSAATGTP